MIPEETSQIIFSRLRLAQQLLEDSDGLPGNEGYYTKEEKWWFHPRHEREALVVYLLLTCFDKLGQKQNFTSFGNWLRSQKIEHEMERNNILSSIEGSLSVVESSVRLLEGYEAIYGVRNAFYTGVAGLPEKVKNQLLESVGLCFNAEFGTHGPNVSTPSKLLENEGLEYNLKLKYLYGKRNGFTHKLDQYHSCSIPAMSDRLFKNGSSWRVRVENKSIVYVGTHQDREIVPTGGAYVYVISGWPFVLFESLYAALGMVFDRTSINLKFSVTVCSDDGITCATYNDVDHKCLKDYETFIRIAGLV